MIEKRIMRKLIIILVLALLISGCPGGLPKGTLEVNGTALTVEVARTDEERANGLMNRETLGETEGMLFVFDNDEKRAFWMKNTPLPLSIAYISREGIILEIHDMKPLSLEQVRSKQVCRYALELNRGAFDTLGIKVGDRLNIAGMLADM